MATQPEMGQSNQVSGADTRSDLSPNPAADQNRSTDELDRLSQTAYDIQALHDRLVNLSSVELRQVPVLKDGAALEPDKIYINLNDAKRREFVGSDGMTVKPGTYIVPKDDVCYDLWNRLTNVG
ncbi:MAG: hypothetical protein AAFU71_19085 [Cyanobacteria bacterium J06632_22]